MSIKENEFIVKNLQKIKFPDSLIFQKKGGKLSSSFDEVCVISP